jgi:hypothetical protein
MSLLEENSDPRQALLAAHHHLCSCPGPNLLCFSPTGGNPGKSSPSGVPRDTGGAGKDMVGGVRHHVVKPTRPTVSTYVRCDSGATGPPKTLVGIRSRDRNFRDRRCDDL